MSKTFGELLKELRKKKGRIYSQSKVARDLSNMCGYRVAKSTVSTWELNLNCPDIHMLKQIATYFNVSTDFLLGIETDPLTQEAFNPAVKQIREMLTDMDVSSKEFLENVSSLYYETTKKRDEQRGSMRFTSVIDCYNIMIQASSELEKQGEDTLELRMDFLKSKGKIHLNRFEHKKALECYERAYELCKLIPESMEQQEELLNLIGYLQLRMGYYRMAQISYERALEVSEDNVRTGVNQLNLGIVHDHLGNFEKAIFFLEKSLQSFKHTGSKKYLPNVFHSLGALYWKTGSYHNAIQSFKEALKLAEIKKDSYRQALNVAGLGVVFRKIGLFQQSIDCHNDALKVALEISRKTSIGQQYFNISVTNHEEGNFSESIENLDNALKVYKEIDDVDGISEVYVELGRIHVKLDDATKAREYLERAQSLSSRVNDPELNAELNLGFAEYYRAIGDRETSRDSAAKAIEICEQYGLPVWEYYLFRSHLLDIMKLPDAARADCRRCIQGIERIMKQLPDEYLDVFKERADVRKAFELMKTLSEILP